MLRQVTTFLFLLIQLTLMKQQPLMMRQTANHPLRILQSLWMASNKTRIQGLLPMAMKHTILLWMMMNQWWTIRNPSSPSQSKPTRNRWRRMALATLCRGMNQTTTSCRVGTRTNRCCHHRCPFPRLSTRLTAGSWWRPATCGRPTCHRFLMWARPFVPDPTVWSNRNTSNGAPR